MDNSYKCVVVIPVYKSVLDADEEFSLRRCLMVLTQYDICVVAPKELNLDKYIVLFQSLGTI